MVIALCSRLAVEYKLEVVLNMSVLPLKNFGRICTLCFRIFLFASNDLTYYFFKGEGGGIKLEILVVIYF